MRRGPATVRYAAAQMVDKIADNPEELLRAAIASGRLQPNERLVEADLTRRLGVGRSAVRTALVRLEQEGLVSHERHRGARVRLVDADEAVETPRGEGGARGADRAPCCDPGDQCRRREQLRAILTEMRQLLDAGDLLGASDQNAVLHRRAARDRGSRRPRQRLIATLKSQLVRFQYRTILLPGRRERVTRRAHGDRRRRRGGGPGRRGVERCARHLSRVARGACVGR